MKSDTDSSEAREGESNGFEDEYQAIAEGDAWYRGRRNATTNGSSKNSQNSASGTSNRIRLAIAWILFLNVMCGLDTEATDVVIKILLPLA